MTIGSIEDALAQAGVTAASLARDDALALDAEGYTILRGAIPQASLDDLRARFEGAILAADKWPAPREAGLRHAMLQDDDAVRRVCLSPPLLACVHHALKHRFFLAAVQGRDPCLGGGYQALHRDWPDDGEGPRMVVGLAFLDAYGKANGATRLVPATQNEPGELSDYAIHGTQHPRQIAVEGEAGDVLLFHGRLVHSGMTNLNGAPRRTLQICWRSHSTIDSHRETRDLAPLTALDRYLLGAE